MMEITPKNDLQQVGLRLIKSNWHYLLSYQFIHFRRNIFRNYPYIKQGTVKLVSD